MIPISAILKAFKMLKGCWDFIGCSAHSSCFLLTFLGIPGFIIGVLANIGVF